MSARLRYVETIGVGELVFVCSNGIAQIGLVTRIAKDDPRFGTYILTVRIAPTSEQCGYTIEALPRALMPLPPEAASWGLRFVPGYWRA